MDKSEKEIEEGVAAVTEGGSAAEGQSPSPSAESKRAAWLSRYREANSEAGEDVDDDTLYGYADDEYSRVRSEYDSLNSVNEKLAEQIMKDASFGAVIAMVVNGAPFEYAIGRLIGNPADVLEGKDLEEYKRGLAEKEANDKEWRELDARRKANLEALFVTIDKFASENSLTEEDAAELKNDIVTELYGALMNEYSEEAVAAKWKGRNYDRDLEKAAAEGEAVGRNAKIVSGRKSFAGASNLEPRSSGAGQPSQAVAVPKEEKYYDFGEMAKKVSYG